MGRRHLVQPAGRPRTRHTSRSLRLLTVMGGVLAVGVAVAAWTPPIDTSGASGVSGRGRPTGTTTLISVNRFGTGSGNGNSVFPVLSADGRVVAFMSFASDLVANDTNEQYDVFVRSLP